MTNEPSSNESMLLPLLLRFAIPLGALPTRLLRYDRKRQIAEVLVEDRWIDASDARAADSGTTRITKVHAETTDDE
jgi:hypothetical protein